MKFETNNKPIEMFSLSSLTDIVMLLLIFFLLSSQFVIQTGVKVKLPGSKTNEEVISSPVSVSIDESRQIYIGTEITDLDRLPGKLAQLLKEKPEDNIVIRADKTVSIDLVIKVIDAAKSAGITKFTLEAEKTIN